MNFSFSLTENARRYPEHLAVVDGDTRLTYEQFNSRVNNLARHLLEGGFGRGAVIAILMYNCAEFLETYFACMRIGAVCVPLNYRLARDEVRHELDHSGCSAVFTEAAFHDVVGTVLQDLGAMKLVVTTSGRTPDGWRSHDELASGNGACVPDAPVSLDDVQRIMYTSGTTSRPRAVMITHGQVYWGAMTRVADFNLTPQDVNLTVGPLYHVGALDTNATPVLFVGGTVVVHKNFRPAEVMRAIDEEGITNCWMAPSMVNMVFQLPDLAKYDTSSLRILVLGGETMPLPLLERVLSEWPNVGVYDGYGLTEAQGLVTILPPQYSVSKLGSVGWAGRGRELRLVDDAGRDVPDGTPGEVIIRGPLVFPGYFQDDEATQSTLRDGWLYTGDMAVRDPDGFFYIVDRKKDMIRSGGENIAASEVERVIYQLPEIGEAAVVAMADDKWGEVPVAFLVPREGHAIDPRTVIAHCAKQLARFKVPKAVHVVDSLPRTPSGKVMKKNLRAALNG